ncbi:MAG: alpha/beta hydrolase [Acidimicrobiia bacterium]
MTDRAVEAAIAHWAPRFVTNGVPMGDFTEVTAGIERWDDWCSAWSRRAEFHEALGRQALEAGHHRSAGEHLVRAALCFHFGKFLFVHDPPQMRAAHQRAVAVHREALPHLDPPGERVEIPFDGASLVGNLRRPTGVGRPPMVIMVMGLDSAKEEVGCYEQTFLDRGLSTLAFDGPGQGEAEYDLPMRHDWEVPVGAVADFLKGRSDLDGDRIGLWGVSLGGHYVVRAAAFDARIRACVSLSGAYAVLEAWEQRPDISRLAYRVRSHLSTEEETVKHLRDFDLKGVVSRVRCPLYVVGGANDRLVPPSAAQRIAAEASGPTVLNFVEGGNHVANNKPYAYRPQSADWLAEHLGGRS